MLNRLSLKCEYSHTYLGGGGSDKPPISMSPITSKPQFVFM